MECKGYPKANKNCSMLCTNFGFASFCLSFVFMDGCRSGFLGGKGIGCEDEEDPALDPEAAPCVDVDVRGKPRGSM